MPLLSILQQIATQAYTRKKWQRQRTVARAFTTGQVSQASFLAQEGRQRSVYKSPAEKRGFQMQRSLLRRGGDSWTRTSDPLRVKQVLSQLSYASILWIPRDLLYNIPHPKCNPYFYFLLPAKKLFKEIGLPFFSFSSVWSNPKGSLLCFSLRN